MPKRFLLTPDVFNIQQSPTQAANFLHESNATRSLRQLNLTRDANNCLVVPADQAVVMMGTTSELEQELTPLRSQGVRSFVSGQAGAHALPRFAGRTKTSEDGGVGFKHEVSVIVLCATSEYVFDEKVWTKLLGGGSLSLATLLNTELATIKALKAS